jgi:hypothetical protein
MVERRRVCYLTKEPFLRHRIADLRAKQLHGHGRGAAHVGAQIHSCHSTVTELALYPEMLAYRPLRSDMRLLA